MDVYVSGIASRVAFVEGGSVHYIDADNPELRVRSSLSMLPNLFLGAADVKRLASSSVREGLTELLVQACKDRALRLFQAALEFSEIDEIVFEASALLSPLLQAPMVREYVEHIAYSVVSPYPVSSGIERWLAPDQEVRALFLGVIESQKQIRSVRDAWDALPLELFRDHSARLKFEAAAVHEGIFKSAVDALRGKKKASLARFDALSALSAHFNCRDVVAGWFGLLEFSPESSSNHYISINYYSDYDWVASESVESEGPSFADVMNRQNAIVSRLQKGDLVNARKFADQLVSDQIAHGRSDLAAKTLCSLAQEAKRLRRHELQLEWVDAATSANPEDPWTFAQAGDAYLGQYKFHDADALFKRAAQLGDEPYGMYGQSRVLRASARYSEALQLLQPLLASDSKGVLVPKIQHEVGTLLLELGRPYEALRHYELAIAASPYEGILHCGRAGILRELGELSEALEAYDLAVQHYPEQLLAFLGKAGTLKDLGRFADAKALYREAALRFPEEVIAQAGEANVLRHEGALTEAKCAFIHVIQIFPNQPHGYRGLALTLRDQREYSGALDVYNSSIERFKFDIRLRNGHAGILKMLGRMAEALKAYDINVRDFPFNMSALMGRANLLKELGKAEDALAAYRDILKIRPDFKPAMYSMAAVFVMLGRYQDAAELLPVEQPRSKAEWIGHHVRAMVHLRQGELDQAIAQLEFGRTNNPHFKHKAYYQTALAIAQIAKGNFAAAIEMVEEAPGPLGVVIEFHSAAALGLTKQAEMSLGRLLSDGHPNVIVLADVIARRFGMSPGPTFSEQALLEAEVNVALALAA